MKVKQYLSLIVCTVLILMLIGCSKQQNAKELNNTSKKQLIVVTISQLGEPLSVIAGDFFNIKTLMGTGVDPHLYQVTPNDIKVINESSAILYNGLHLEANMLEVFEQMSKTKPVLAVGEKLNAARLIEDENGVIDPHIWFDLELWAEAISHAVDLLEELNPEYKEQLQLNENAYLAKLQTQHKQNSETLLAVDKEKRVLVTAHDAFQYFGRAYDIEVIGLQGISTEAEVSLSTVEQIVSMLVERQIAAVFVESSVNPAAIQAVIEGASVKGHTVQLGGELFSDAMGPADDVTGTYLGMYSHNVVTIVNGLNGEMIQHE